MQWEDALAQALTGASLVLEPGEEVLAGLARQGWDRAAIAAHAEAVWDAGAPWPHPSPAAAAAFGAARWHAALDDLRSQLGLDIAPQAPSRRTTLDADERRLLQDRPPHWG